MEKPFDELRERLLRAGVAPRHARRYVSELGDHLDDLRAEEDLRDPATAQALALSRLGGIDSLSRAFIQHRQFQSWSARAPWAVFGVAPLLALACAYCAACLILWSGWQIFLPQSDTPFVPLGGPEIFYFGAGKLLYFCAPIVISWGIGLIAARQRLGMAWPTLGFAPVAVAAGMARVHASRPGGVEDVGMEFTLGSTLSSASHVFSHALVIFALSALPFLVWRLRERRWLAG